MYLIKKKRSVFRRQVGELFQLPKLSPLSRDPAKLKTRNENIRHGRIKLNPRVIIALRLSVILFNRFQLIFGFRLCCYLIELLARGCEMGWLLIFASLIVLWVASLCKILHTSSSASTKISFLNNGRALAKKNVLLVVAHPDDESMFFSPTISYLISRGHSLYILCLSIGNADGMGNTRKEELYQACAVLKVPLQQVKVLDHPNLQDGFGQVWDKNLLAKIIGDEVSSHNIDMIITFDNYGISGHCNHRDVHFGIRKLLPDISERNVEAWELVSTNIIRKYIGPVDIWLSLLLAMKHTNGMMHCLLNEQPLKSFHAMAEHSSQWVWFRKLFVSFSSYTYVNTLRKINS